VLIPNQTYHIYNHANGNENLFRNNENFYYFLQKYTDYTSIVAFTFAYCLMPNHFHFLVRIKEERSIIDAAFQKFGTFGKLSIEKFITKQFSNLFSSYTQSYNKVYDRKGSLFVPNYKNKIVKDTNHLFNAMNYIHMNPVFHNFVEKAEDWKFSSYNAYFSSKNTKLSRDLVLSDLNCSIDSFKEMHNMKSAEKFSYEMNLFF
jgi:putative transposase